VTEYTVGEVARLSRVSVRTLHHYDSIGLVTPGGRSAAGYRLYAAADLARLRQVLLYRRLDFGLDEIARILADPGTGAEEHLRRQHRLVRERRARDAALLRAIQTEMERRQMGIGLTPQEQFEIFGTDRLGEYAREARERWGDTDAFAQSERATAGYATGDWTAVKAEADEQIRRFAAALRAGEPAGQVAAMDLAEAHRRHISHFYDCGYAAHRGLAELYVSDPRFTATYDAAAPGLAQYVRDAIVANAERAGA
jgi:MerR family transcriptional regulator, thiopeptide resistance regulator